MRNGQHPDKRLFDLGLAIGHATLQPGQTRTNAEIAAFPQAAGAHCSPQRVQQILDKTLRKIRAHLYRDKDLAEALKNR